VTFPSFYDDTNGSKTAIALANQSATAATITVVVLERGGSRLASSQMTLPNRLCTRNISRALIERPYSREPQAVGAVYDRPGFFVQSRFYPSGAFTSLPIIQ